ncbi:MAG: SDR family NAD(P)-dependent oxidoreductase [bacterium]|nr:SDR family NAD(P)-dependent oxidoreductase [bacterium]
MTISSQTLLNATAPASALAGKVAIVTGAAKGLGAAITLDLARQGADTVLTARDEDALQEHAAHVDSEFDHRSSLVISADVLSEGDVKRLVEAAVDRFGGIDILVNSAGGTGPIETPAQNVDVQAFREILDLNVLGTFIVCKYAIPHMIERRDGRIVNLSGTSGLRGYINRAGYSSSKWAVRGLTRTLALELGPYGITVNAVCPNVTHGDRMTKIVNTKAATLGLTPEEVYADFASQTALGRFIDSEDVAAAVSFLVSNGARNITGHDIVVDAGWDV